MQFPQEIKFHIADFITDEVQGTDPQCYRAARSLQAAWRGRLTRLHRVCNRCGEAGQYRQAHVPLHCWTCDTCRLDYMIQMFEDGAVAFAFP